MNYKMYCVTISHIFRIYCRLPISMAFFLTSVLRLSVCQSLSVFLCIDAVDLFEWSSLYRLVFLWLFDGQFVFVIKISKFQALNLSYDRGGGIICPPFRL